MPIGLAPLNKRAERILPGFVTEKVIPVNSVPKLSASESEAPPSLRKKPITPALPLVPVPVFESTVPW